MRILSRIARAHERLWRGPGILTWNPLDEFLSIKLRILLIQSRIRISSSRARRYSRAEKRRDRVDASGLNQAYPSAINEPRGIPRVSLSSLRPFAALFESARRDATRYSCRNTEIRARIVPSFHYVDQTAAADLRKRNLLQLIVYNEVGAAHETFRVSITVARARARA